MRELGSELKKLFGYGQADTTVTRPSTSDSLLVRAEDLGKQLRNRKNFPNRKNKRSSQRGVKINTEGFSGY